MENPYASPGVSEQTSAEQSVAHAPARQKLPPVAAVGLAFLCFGFALSAIVAAVTGWTLAAPTTFSGHTTDTLHYAMWGLSKVARLGLGIGYFLSSYVPRKSNSTQWAIAAAGIHFIGMAMGSFDSHASVLAVVCSFAGPAAFWLFLHRIAKWAGRESLRLLKTRLAWVGIIALGATLTSGALLMLAETADQFRDSMRVVGIVGGISATAAWTYYAWTTWQFRRQLR